MLEGMLGAALVLLAFAVGHKTGKEVRTSEPTPKTPEEIKRERNFKRLMSYDGGNGDDK